MAHVETTEPTLTLSETAARLGITYRSVARLVSAGKLDAVAIGKNGRGQIRHIAASTLNDFEAARLKTKPGAAK